MDGRISFPAGFEYGMNEGSFATPPLIIIMAIQMPHVAADSEMVARSLLEPMAVDPRRYSKSKQPSGAGHSRKRDVGTTDRLGCS